jgi:hypothetical protein
LRALPTPTARRRSGPCPTCYGSRSVVSGGGRRSRTSAASGGLGQLADGDLEGWGRALSRELDRSVLAIWTWDGESSVSVTRWKRGKKRGSFELLRDATRGADGKPRAPAKVLWPWLPKKEREAILRDGIPLVEKAPGTGDAELDALLEGFDEGDADESADEEGEDGLLWVSLETSLAAIGAAVGLEDPTLNPYDDEDGDTQLLFRPKRGSVGDA